MNTNINRNVSSSEKEFIQFGPNDSFNESIITNFSLIKKRLKTNHLKNIEFIIGRESNTKVYLCYMENICNLKLVKKIESKLNNINIDALLDIGYIEEQISSKNYLFPTFIKTERPDTTCLALLEGKVILLMDNTPYSLIVPSFFIDFFHTPDDYYQKSVNVSFIRIIRLIAFLISIFLPGLYISIITINPNSVSLPLLISFASQRLNVVFPCILEALIMIISFEILRESDARIPSKLGSSVSILGGLILGDAAVNANIVSPIMIIVIAISMISGLIFTSNSLINPIRYYRILILLLCSTLGLFGLFIGIIILIVNISNTNVFDYSYTSPFVPIVKEELYDTFIKIQKKYTRNPITASKNIIRGSYDKKN